MAKINTKLILLHNTLLFRSIRSILLIVQRILPTQKIPFRLPFNFCGGERYGSRLDNSATFNVMETRLLPWKNFFSTSVSFLNKYKHNKHCCIWHVSRCNSHVKTHTDVSSIPVWKHDFILLLLLLSFLLEPPSLWKFTIWSLTFLFEISQIVGGFSSFSSSIKFVDRYKDVLDFSK